MNDSLQLILKNEKPIPLNPQSFKKEERTTFRLGNLMDELVYDSTSVTYKTENNKYDKRIIEMDEYSKEINNILLKNIMRDIYIKEAYRIASDLITFDKK